MLCDEKKCDTWRKWPDVGMWFAYLKWFGEGYWKNAWSESMACRCCWGFFVAKRGVRNPTSLITPAVFFLFASGVLQHVRIKIQNSECIIVVSSDDVIPKGGRTEYVENYIPPFAKTNPAVFTTFCSVNRLKLRSLGEHKSPFQTFIRVLEGYLNDCQQMIQSFQVLTPTNCQGVIGCRG